MENNIKIEVKSEYIPNLLVEVPPVIKKVKKLLTLEEKNLKRAENARKRRAKLTEEQRLKFAEERRLKRANLTEEERLQMAEKRRRLYYARKMRAKQTEEQLLTSEDIREAENKLEEARAKSAEAERFKAAERRRKRKANLTEEERAKLAEIRNKEYQACKMKANFAEERRIKRAEYNRKRAANLTEEQRLKKSEYDRKRRAERVKAKLEQKTLKEEEAKQKKKTVLTPEQRLKRLEYKRKSRANLTQEQRIRARESRYRWYCKLTPEQRARKVEMEKKRIANLTEEKRLRMLENSRKRRSNLTEEQRQKRSENDRIRYANLSREQHLRQLENWRKRKANLTEEQRIKRKEYKRRWNANISPEQRMKKTERERARRAKLSEEQRLREIENQRKRRANYTEEQRNKKLEYNRKWSATRRRQNSNSSTERHKNKSSIKIPENLVLKIINQRIESDINITKGINSIDDVLLKSILNFSHQNIYTELDINCLVAFLKIWVSWTADHPFKNVNSEEADLLCYLHDNFMQLKSLKNKYLLDEVNRCFISESYINVSCSLKQLKSLFYYNPQMYHTYYNKDILINNFSHYLNTPILHYIHNYPNISTTIVLPNFSMEHQNVPMDEFNLLNITNKIDQNFGEEPCLLSQMYNSENISEMYLTKFIAKFLSQLKNAITRRDDNKIMQKRKTEITLAIIELEKDIALCSDTIETHTTYSMGLTRNPYVRYMGHFDDDFDISIERQKLIMDPILNVRLQEIRRPVISFKLTEFSVPHVITDDDINFIFDELFLDKINHCINYKCLLCNENLGSYAPSQGVSEHLHQCHGNEPDWECSKCSKSFSNDDLIMRNWSHDCKPTI